MKDRERTRGGKRENEADIAFFIGEPLLEKGPKTIIEKLTEDFLNGGQG